MGERTEAQQVEMLVQAAAAGDVDAQGALLERYWPMIRRVVHARRQCQGLQHNPREDTEDAMQDVALRVLHGLPHLEWQGGTALGAWVRRLADAQVKDAGRFHRAARRRFAAGDPIERTGAPTLANGSARTSAESRVDRRRDLLRLEADLQKIKDNYAATLRLRGAGYTHAQIADILGCTEEAARKLESRGRAALARVRGA